jgi:regulatory protein
LKDSPAKARAYALKLLSYRSRSSKEMRGKLEQKGFSNALVIDTVDFLERSGLMNDDALASELFRYATEKKSLGKNGVKLFLIKSGIDKDRIDQILMEHTIDMEEQSAGEFVERKLRTLIKYPEDVVRRRLWGMLQRRGFSYDVIKRAINSVKL